MGWLDPADVSRWLRQPPSEDAAQMAEIASAVEPFVQRCRPDKFDPDAAVYLPDREVYTAAVMMAARLYRRRLSPAGLVQIGELIATTPRWDPDTDRALRIGAWRTPRVG